MAKESDLWIISRPGLNYSEYLMSFGMGIASWTVHRPNAMQLHENAARHALGMIIDRYKHIGLTKFAVIERP